MKLETAIKDACLELKKNKIKTPLLDSEILMSKAINKEREFLILNLTFAARVIWTRGHYCFTKNSIFKFNVS